MAGGDRLFATDLDRTLIYSLEASGGAGSDLVHDLCVVEHLDGAPLSFMTNRALGLLRELCAELLVVPVTTRTMAQYGRIELFSTTMVPEYAVAANGGHLVHRGEPDLDWYGAVRAELAASCAGAEEIVAEVEQAGRDWARRVRIADQLFVYAIVDRPAIEASALRDLEARAATLGWVLSLQGRKLYVVPRPLDKWRAVDEIRRRTGITTVAAAGDSLLDRCLLDNCSMSARPAHGELEAAGYRADFVTQGSGVKAAEELLEAVLAWGRCRSGSSNPQ